MSRSRAQGKGTPLAKLLKMRAFGALGVIVVAAFYVAWPLYAGYEIKSSLDAGDAARLSSRIDFASVRVSLRPAVAKQVEDVIEAQLRKAGAMGSLVPAQLKDTLIPQIAEGVLVAFVTPEMLIRVHASGRSLKEALESIVIERASLEEGGLGRFLVVSEGGQDPQGERRSRLEEIAGSFGVDVGKVLGGLAVGAEAAQAQGAEPAGPRPNYGLGNIKHVSVVGPLGLSIGVSRDPKGSRPELTAEMGFVDGSWKLTGLVPAL